MNHHSSPIAKPQPRLARNLKLYVFRCRAILGLAASAIALLICDGGLQVVAWFSPRAVYHLSEPWSRNRIPDAALGFRLSPYYAGHDSRGYRNEVALTAADVLAIGDSFTYGYAAPPQGSWPRQLASRSGLTVYNAGVGSYGPCEYERVLDELLLELNPRMVVLGLYLGNDIADAHGSVYSEHRCFGWRSAQSQVLAAMSNADAGGTMEDFARQLDRPQYKPAPLLAFWRHSAVYRAGRSLRHFLTEDAERPLRLADDSFEAAARRPHRIAFDAAPQFRTVFVGPDVAHKAVDLQDPRVNEGWRITRGIIQSMQHTLGLRGVDLVVLIVHTKEYTYSQLVREHQAGIDPSFFRLVERESELSAKVRNFLAAHRITFVDTDAAVGSTFSRGLRPYPVSDDIHLNTIGYSAIAEAALRVMRPAPSLTAAKRTVD